jgi:hypothetical protein
MSGADHRGFDWKEVAEVLRTSRVVARAAFWREISRSRSGSVEAQPLAKATQPKRDSDTRRFSKSGASQ